MRAQQFCAKLALEVDMKAYKIEWSLSLLNKYSIVILESKIDHDDSIDPYLESLGK